MNDYITLDGKQYRAAHENWEPTEDRPMIVRRLMSGGTNVTFGPATFTGWGGTVMADVGAVAPFGTPADLRATYKKRAALSFTDHYGTVHSVVIDRRVGEKSISPMHDAADNTFRMNMTLIKL
jgi:hypothetical protein